MLNKAYATLISLSVLLMIFSTTSYGAQDANRNMINIGHTEIEVKNILKSGQFSLKKTKVKEGTIVNGPFDAESSFFIQETLVNGQLHAKDSQFNQLTVNGDTHLSNVIVMGAAAVSGKVELQHTEFDSAFTVNGPLAAKDSTFKKLLTLSNNKTDLENCTLQNVLVKKISTSEPQTLNLKNTRIDGEILFESGLGVINMDEKSFVGKVTGAQIIKNK